MSAVNCQSLQRIFCSPLHWNECDTLEKKTSFIATNFIGLPIKKTTNLTFCILKGTGRGIKNITILFFKVVKAICLAPFILIGKTLKVAYKAIEYIVLGIYKALITLSNWTIVPVANFLLIQPIKSIFSKININCCQDNDEEFSSHESSSSESNIVFEGVEIPDDFETYAAGAEKAEADTIVAVADNEENDLPDIIEDTSAASSSSGAFVDLYASDSSSEEEVIPSDLDIEDTSAASSSSGSSVDLYASDSSSEEEVIPSDLDIDKLKELWAQRAKRRRGKVAYAEPLPDPEFEILPYRGDVEKEKLPEIVTKEQMIEAFKLKKRPAHIEYSPALEDPVIEELPDDLKPQSNQDIMRSFAAGRIPGPNDEKEIDDEELLDGIDGFEEENEFSKPLDLEKLVEGFKKRIESRKGKIQYSPALEDPVLEELPEELQSQSAESMLESFIGNQIEKSAEEGFSAEESASDAIPKEDENETDKAIEKDENKQD